MPDQSPNRRRFVSWLTTGVMTAIGALLAAPAIAYVWSPLWKKRAADKADSESSDAGPIAESPPGAWRLVTIEVVRKDGWETSRASRSVWVRRAADGAEKFAVLSSTCPHLGCSIMWIGNDNRFLCPCHHGAFDAEGRLVGGPPPRGMDALESEVRDGRLWVRWQDFKIGTPDRISVEA